MSLSKLQPFAGNHAIQNAAFVLEWSTPLNSNTLAAIGEIDGLKQVFPTVQTMQLITVNLDGGQSTPTQSNDIGGVHFIHQNPKRQGAIIKSVQVTQNNCVVVIGEYTGWEDVWKQVRSWFDLLLPVILNGRPITAVALQYSDSFSWRDDAGALNYEEFFKKDSPYLPRNALELKDLWHSHHGFFQMKQEPLPHRLLNNVNINIGDNADMSREIGLLTVHKADSFAVWSVDDARSLLDSMMPTLHELDKQTLRNLLSDDVLKMIGLQ